MGTTGRETTREKPGPQGREAHHDTSTNQQFLSGPVQNSVHSTPGSVIMTQSSDAIVGSLSLIVERWPSLPASIQKGIIAIVSEFPTK